jgi:hypothetical protein
MRSERCTTSAGRVSPNAMGTLDGRKYTQQEIAEAMGTSQQAVAKLEYWGRKRLLGVVK